MVDTYLDASVLVPILLEEQGSPVVDAWIRSTDTRLRVSDLAAAEVSSAISRAIRIGRETTAGAERRLRDFDAWRGALTVDVEIRPEDVRMADRFVRRFDLKLRTPDAIHAAVALRIGATLLTFDRRLLLAAAAVGVEASAPTAVRS